MKYIKNKIQATKQLKKEQPVAKTTPINLNVEINIQTIKDRFIQTNDLVTRKFTIATNPCYFFCMEGMVNIQAVSQGIMNPILSQNYKSSNGNEQYATIKNNVLALAEVVELIDIESAITMAMSGFVVIFIEGSLKAIAIGAQGFNFRSVSEATTEASQRGSREGFIEVLRINLTMIRRRLKTTKLRFEMLQVGSVSKTDVCLCYLDDKVNKDILKDVRRKISNIPLQTVLESGYIQPFLEDKPMSLFSSVGVVERPDTLCGKLTEGRIGILVDGTPMALIVPYLFIENFQTMDDYALSPYFSSLARIVRYLCFFISILLPGLFVSIGTFHPELFPTPLLYNLVDSQTNQPFSLMVQALIIHFIYEIMREAGLRLPKPIGHAVGIIGGLVIGDAAVKAGLISSPMIMVVALTALASFVIPKVYEPMAILRFAFIIVGGTFYFMGVMLLLALVITNIASLNSYGIPYLSPVSPFRLKSMRDVFIRASWVNLSKKTIKVQNMPGSDKLE